jgi:hypothetical protein
MVVQGNEMDGVLVIYVPLHSVGIILGIFKLTFDAINLISDPVNPLYENCIAGAYPEKTQCHFLLL